MSLVNTATCTIGTGFSLVNRLLDVPIRNSLAEVEGYRIWNGKLIE